MKQKILKYLLNLLSKHPTSKERLVLRFVSDDLKRYYGFKGKPTPLRYSRIMKQYSLLCIGLSEENYKKALNGVVEGLKNGIAQYESEKTTKDLTRVFALLFELQARAGQPSYDVILEMLALTIIRQDENPEHINAAIHKEKREYFDELLKNNPDKIQNLPEYGAFYDSGLGGKVINELQQMHQLTNEQINSILAY